MLDGLYPIDDFVGEHDPLCIRVLLLEGENLRQVIVVVDITSLTQEVISRMETILANEAGVDAKNAVITASHTFSTPHIFTVDREASYTSALLNAFENALRLASRLAVSTLQPVSLGSGNGFCRIGVNRNINTPFRIEEKKRLDWHHRNIGSCSVSATLHQPYFDAIIKT